MPISQLGMFRTVHPEGSGRVRVDQLIVSTIMEAAGAGR
jgi:hypothetical protein